jgi:hypothetical protein
VLPSLIGKLKIAIFLFTQLFTKIGNNDPNKFFLNTSNSWGCIIKLITAVIIAAASQFHWLSQTH